MRFAVGYQLTEDGDDPFLDMVRDYREHVAEVYFPWLGMASGRSPLSVRRGFVEWQAQQRLEEDLIALRALGVRLDLLLNANCYGGRAVSQHLQNEVASVLEHLADVCGGADVVTTTSPAIAHTVKQHFPGVEVRASVNMRIGTVKGMQYMADLFDGFYVQRDYNRDLAHIDELKRWADENGKHLYILVNSGCLNFCSGQTFHDNLVAHEAESAEMCNIEDWNPHTCWRYLRDEANWPAVLQNSWIRPEDLRHYDDIFLLGKLATRMHQRPRLVLEAYSSGRYRGNLLDLFEPGYARVFAPRIIANERFPSDWFEQTTTCDKRCDRCGYCAQVLNDTLVLPG
jgi:collagenase-like PrtC family protease